MTASRETVTPQQAVAWLLRPGPTQRPIDEQRVAFLAHAMAAGQWDADWDTQTIDLDSCGRLANGQHRCLAIVRHGAPVIARVRRSMN